MTKRGMRSAVVIMATGLMFLSMVLFLQGCGGTFAGKEVKPFTEMTPKEKSVFLMTTYNKQYDSYVDLYKQPVKTAAQEAILVEKYEWLHEIYPYIDTYTTYAAEGVMPSAETEKIVIELVNKAIGL